jgi:predicted transposase YbfD/YdcC
MAATSVGSIKKHFRKLWDPRVTGRTKHRLGDILVMAICGVIANCNGWREIALFAQKRQRWFRRFLTLPNGIPSHDTFERLFNLLDPKAFQASFIGWIKEISDLVGLKHIAIDGKALRHSANPGKGLGMLHCVNAWATEQHVILGQVMTDAKSNEITAIPKLLELLDLHGALVTIDAMGCQKAIAKKIVERGGDYVLNVKANQKHLLEDIQATVEKAVDGLLPSEVVEEYTKVESGHGRQEERSYTVIHNAEGIRDRDQWEKLSTVGMCRTDKTIDGETTTTVKYFIGSRKMSARKYGKVIRGHWGIENNLHWQLDVNFGEDASTINHRKAGENFAALRRIALSLVKQHPSKESIGRKRMEAALDPVFLAEILTGSSKDGKL